MCLFTTTKNPFVASEDFGVWKVVWFSEQEQTTWRGAYNFSSKSFLFDEKLQEGPFDIRKTIGSKNIYEIYGGCFHSVVFEDIELATDILSSLNNKYHGGRIMCKCTIPRGTEYYMGGSMVASKNIIVHKPKIL